MARSNRKKTKPAVKSKGATSKLGYGQCSKNYSTLKNKEKAEQQEEEFKS